MWSCKFGNSSVKYWFLFPLA